MFWKIIGRQMLQKRMMTLMLFALMTMLVSLFVYIQNTTAYANRSMQLIMKNMGLNQFLAPAHENPMKVYLCSEDQVLFPEAVAVQMAQETRLLSKYYVALLQKRWVLDDTEVIVSGIRPLSRPDESKEKASMVKSVPSGEVRLGGIAAELLNRKVGDRLTLNGQSFRVGQVLAEKGTLEDCRVYLSLAAAQKMLGAEGQIHSILSFECLHVGGTLDHIHAFQRDALQELFPHYRQYNIDSIAQGRYYARRMTTGYLGCLSVVIMLIAILVVALCGFQDVNDRKYETGVLISMGVGYGYISSLYIVKILLLSLLASVAGYGIGAYLSVGLTTPFLVTNTHHVAISWVNLPTTVLAGMGVALLGQLLPIARLFKLDPHTILAED